MNRFAVLGLSIALLAAGCMNLPGPTPAQSSFPSIVTPELLPPEEGAPGLSRGVGGEPGGKEQVSHDGEGGGGGGEGSLPGGQQPQTRRRGGGKDQLSHSDEGEGGGGGGGEGSLPIGQQPQPGRRGGDDQLSHPGGGIGGGSLRAWTPVPRMRPRQ